MSEPLEVVVAWRPIFADFSDGAAVTLPSNLQRSQGFQKCIDGNLHVSTTFDPKACCGAHNKVHAALTNSRWVPQAACDLRDAGLLRDRCGREFGCCRQHRPRCSLSFQPGKRTSSSACW
jgi:hypothetical protein